MKAQNKLFWNIPDNWSDDAWERYAEDCYTDTDEDEEDYEFIHADEIIEER